VRSRITVFISIYTEDGEVARMSWPFPVVGVGSELTDATWRRAYKTYIVIILVNKIVVFISIVERFYVYYIFAVFRIFFFDFSNLLLDNGVTFFFGHLVVYQA